MPSARFKSLRSNVRELRKLLLPAKFSGTGTYPFPKRVSARTLSYRVLAHAEIETYLEDRAEEICNGAWLSWTTKKSASDVVLHLLAYSGREMTVPPNTLQAPNKKSTATWATRELSIFDRLDKSVKRHTQEVIKRNHGITERNVLRLILPLGFDMAKCDPLTLASLNQFGQDRGLAAHTSAFGSVTHFVDPKDEYEKVRKLIGWLLPFDVEFDRLLRIATA